MSVGLISPLISSMGQVDDIHKAKTIFGEIDEIVITPATFPAFQKIWRDFTSQNRIRGIAGKQGNIKYVRAN